MSPPRIRTLIVDDSALARRIITQSLAPFPEIEVVGTATDPYDARGKILALNPAVLTLNIEMPRMDGLTFLRRLLQYRPMPVIIFASCTPEGSAKALEALQVGAVDVLGKPSEAELAFNDGSMLAERIALAAQTQVRRIAVQSESNAVLRQRSARMRVATGRTYSPRQIILMGASTGGTEALKTVLASLRSDLPGICIVQHIPAYFAAAFAKHLNDLCALNVREAQAGDVVQPGLALVVPGGCHLVLKWKLTHYAVELTEAPEDHSQRPAVDAMFESAVRAGAGTACLAVLLTGVGVDGAAGLLSLRQAGATTIAQDEKSSLVCGMPRAALERGAAMKVCSLDQMAAEIERHASGAATDAARDTA